MNPEERIMEVFRRRKPDAMPWFADLTYWCSAQEYRGTMPQKYRGKGRTQLYRDLGCGAHEELYNLPADLNYYDMKMSSSQERHRDETVLYENGYHTPVGSIVSVRKFLPESCSTAYLKYPVASAHDLKVLRYVYEHQEVKTNYDLQFARLEDWKGLGIVSSLPPRTPFARLLVEWAGALNTIRLLARAREEVEETLDVMARADDPIYEIIEESPASMVYFGENITSEWVTPSIFKRYYAPYYRRRVAQLHAKGKFIFVHIDGTLRGVLPLMAETGVDCAQSVTPAPVGDLPVSRLRGAAGPEIILWGGAPGAYFSPAYPEGTLRSMVLEIIKYHMEGGRFILGVADQIPADGDIGRVRLVSDLVERHARY